MNFETTRRSLWAIVAVCAAAHGSHLVTDWLGTDLSKPAGIQLLWPLSDQWFISNVNIFPQIERRNILSAPSMAINVKAVVWETALLGTLVSVLWWWRSHARASNRRRQSEGV